MTLIPVNSSAIRAIGYDGYTLAVVFRHGGRNDHPGVPSHVYERLMQATSKGRFYATNIRGRYR